jgi:hypothetical protein
MDAAITSSHGTTITIGRDQHPATHQVSAELVDLEDQQTAHICVAERVQAKEVESESCAETLRSMKNGMRRGEGRKGHERNREGQLAGKEEFEWLRVLDRILRVDEENRVKAGSDDEEEGKSSSMPHHVASSSSPAGHLHATTLPPASLRATPSDNNYEDEAGAVPSNLSPASPKAASRFERHTSTGVASGVCQEPMTNWMSRMTMTRRVRKKCRCHPLLPSPFSIRTISSAPVYGLVLFIVPHSLLLICYVNKGNGKFNKNTDGITTTMRNHFKLRHSKEYESNNK